MANRGAPIQAHYDGKVIVPDGPIDLPPGTSFTLTIESILSTMVKPNNGPQSEEPDAGLRVAAMTSRNEVRIECGGESFVFPMPAGRDCYTIHELVELGWLVPLDRVVTLISGKSVGPGDKVHGGQTIVQLPSSGTLSAGVDGGQSVIQDRMRRLDRAIGIFEAPPPPLEALRRDALYDDAP